MPEPKRASAIAMGRNRIGWNYPDTRSENQGLFDEIGSFAGF